MKIRKIHPGDNDFNLFSDFVKDLYPENSIRLRQKDEPAKEFLIACFIAESNDRIIGRAALYLNPYLLKNGRTTVCIGNYEFADDTDLSTLFLEHLFEESKLLGAEFIFGPMNGSTWENYRFTLDHSSPGFLLEPHHHLYYNDQFIAVGFQLLATYSSNKEEGFEYDFPQVVAHEKQFAEAGLIIRSIDPANYEDELKKLYPFVERSFADNYLYSPLSWESFRDKYMEAAKIIQPEFVLLAEFEHSVVGFIFAYTDLYNSSAKSLVIKTLARDPDNKWKGLGEILGNRVLRNAHQNGYTNQIHAFMKDTNRSVKTSEKFHGEGYKKYALYGREI